PGGKGETVLEETTSAPGDRCGSVNPTRSKTRQEVPEGCPPELPGRSLEACGNVGPRWMAATAPSGAGQNPAYRPAHPPIRSPGAQSGAQTGDAVRWLSLGLRPGTQSGAQSGDSGQGLRPGTQAEG